MENKSLIAIIKDIESLEVMLVESGGELTPEIEALLSATDMSLPEKIDSFSFVIARMKSLDDFYKAKADQYLRMAKASVAVVDRCKTNLKYAMEALNTDELLGNEIRFKLSSAKPKVMIRDESTIPKEYLREKITTVIDKDRLADDLKLGIPIEGVTLEPSFSLREYPISLNKKQVTSGK